MSLTLLAGSLAGWLDLVAGWLCLGWLAATKMQKLDVVAICYLVITSFFKSVELVDASGRLAGWLAGWLAG